MTLSNGKSGRESGLHLLAGWGRSVAHCVKSIQELVSLGIRFLSPTESIDTGADSPMSKFLMHLFAAFAERERG